MLKDFIAKETDVTKGTVYISGILTAEDNGRLTSCREQHDIAVRLLQLRIESVKNSFPFVCHTV